jgi:hypothetical protein
MSLRKHGGQWWLEQPLAVEVPANPLRIKSLLDVTETASQSSFPATGKDLGPFGLDEPDVILRLPGATFAFGGSDALNGWRYVLSGDTVHLIADTLYWFLSADSATFVSRQLLPEGAAIKALYLPQLSIEQVDGHWQVEPPAPDISADAIQALLDSWRRAQAIAVEQQEPGTQGEALRVELAPPHQTLELLVTETEPDLILVRPDAGLRYRLPATANDDLLSLRQHDSGAGADATQ